MKKNPLLRLAATVILSGVSGVFADITYDISSDYVLDADYSISQIQTVSNGATYTIAKSLTNSASGYALTLSNGNAEVLAGGSLLITSSNSGIKLDQKIDANGRRRKNQGRRRRSGGKYHDNGCCDARRWFRSRLYYGKRK